MTMAVPGYEEASAPGLAAPGNADAKAFLARYAGALYRRLRSAHMVGRGARNGAVRVDDPQARLTETLARGWSGEPVRAGALAGHRHAVVLRNGRTPCSQDAITETKRSLLRGSSRWVHTSPRSTGFVESRFSWSSSSTSARWRIRSAFRQRSGSSVRPSDGRAWTSSSSFPATSSPASSSIRRIGPATSGTSTRGESFVSSRCITESSRSC